MNVFKGAIEGKRLGWLTISLTILSAAVYIGISSFTISGMTGFLTLSVVIFYWLENTLYRITTFRVGKSQGVILLILSLVYLICQFINKELFGSIIFLSSISGLALFVLMWAILPNIKNYTDKIAVMLSAVGLLIALVYIWQNAGVFTPDSYSYYEIAQTIGKDFGKIGTIRQYIIKTDYNISFPYFYPLCIFIIDKITKLGRYSGVLFNFYIMLFTCILFLHISKKVVNKLWCGEIAIFLLTATPKYLGEVSAARSIPLAIFLSTVAFCLLADVYFKKKSNGFIFLLEGIVVGLLISTRFDGLVMAVYCALLVILCNGKRIQHLLLYVVGLGTSACPWIIYSLIHFGKIWVSDNSGTAFLVSPSIPTRITIPGDGTLTLFNAPIEWMHSLVGKTIINILSLGACSLMADICILVCLVMIISAIRKKLINKNSIIALVVVAVFYAGKTAMFILVGYGDGRYHVESVVLAAFVLMMICEYLGLRINKKRLLVLITGIEIVLTLFTFRNVGYNLFTSGLKNNLVNIEVEPKWVSELNDELSENINDKTSGILFLSDGYTFGGWTDWKVYATPASSEWRKIEYAMKNYMDVEYIVISKKYTNNEVLMQLNNLYSKTNLSKYYLYKLGE